MQWREAQELFNTIKLDKQHFISWLQTFPLTKKFDMNAEYGPFDQYLDDNPQLIPITEFRKLAHLKDAQLKLSIQPPNKLVLLIKSSYIDNHWSILTEHYNYETSCIRDLDQWVIEFLSSSLERFRVIIDIKEGIHAGKRVCASKYPATVAELLDMLGSPSAHQL